MGTDPTLSRQDADATRASNSPEVESEVRAAEMRWTRGAGGPGARDGREDGGVRRAGLTGTNVSFRHLLLMTSRALSLTDLQMRPALRVSAGDLRVPVALLLHKHGPQVNFESVGGSLPLLTPLYWPRAVLPEGEDPRQKHSLITCDPLSELPHLVGPSQEPRYQVGRRAGHDTLMENSAPRHFQLLSTPALALGGAAISEAPQNLLLAPLCVCLGGQAEHH